MWFASEDQRAGIISCGSRAFARSAWTLPLSGEKISMVMHVRRILQLAVAVTMALPMADVCLGQTAATQDSERQMAIAGEQQGNYVEAETAWRAFLEAHPRAPSPTLIWVFLRLGRSATSWLCLSIARHSRWIRRCPACD